eukprot:gene31596-4635_t
MAAGSPSKRASLLRGGAGGADDPRWDPAPARRDEEEGADGKDRDGDGDRVVPSRERRTATGSSP